MEVRIDSSLVLELVHFVRLLPLQLFEETGASSQTLHEHPLFFQSIQLPSVRSASPLFVETMCVHPLLVTLTTRVSPSHSFVESILPGVSLFTPIEALVDSLGSFVSNVDSAQITLDSFLASNLFMGKSEFARSLSSHYLKQALLQLYRVVGSISVLGNPVGLIQSVGSGVRDFFVEPFRGIVEGPDGFVCGVGRGALSLLQNASYGVLNSVGRITSSIGDSLSLLTMNDSFVTNRAAGKNGIMYGVKEGVLGLLMDPIEGALESGFLGALRGTGRGLFGFVAKPVTGLFDDTSRVIDSLKDVAQSSSRVQRVRPSRYIYPDRVLTPFCAYLSQGKELLASADFDDRYLVHVPDCQNNAFVLAQERAVLLCADGSVVWSMDYEGVESVTTEYNVMSIRYRGTPYTVVMQSSTLASWVLLIIEGCKADAQFDASSLIRRVAVHYGEKAEAEDDSLAMCDEPDYRAGEMDPRLKVLSVASAMVIGHHHPLSGSGEVFFVRVESTESKSWTVHRRYSDFE